MNFAKKTLIIILFSFIWICSSNNANEKSNSIVFDSPDLTKEYKTDYGTITLRAYKSKLNDLIIQNKNYADYRKLKWYSLGYPQLAYFLGNNNESLLFDFNSQGFEASVEMLTSKHKLILKNLVKEIHNISVEEDQIENLELSKFECRLSFYNKLKEISIKGNVNALNFYPFRLVFNEPVDAPNRNLFEKRLKDKDFKIGCNAYSVCGLFNTSYAIQTMTKVKTINDHMSITEEISKLKKNTEDLGNTFRNEINEMRIFIEKNLNSIEFFKEKMISLVKFLQYGSYYNILFLGTVKRTLRGHKNWVKALVVLPNGDLASGSDDNTIKIWNTEDGTVKRTLEAHTDWVLRLAALPNGDLASGSGDDTIKIWNTADGTVKRTLQGHESWVRALVVLPNGDLVSGSDDTKIKIWNTADGTVKSSLQGHTNSVVSLVVLPNGDLASGSGDRTIKIWNTADGTVKRTLKGHGDWVRALVVLLNGDLASGSDDRTIKIWNTADGTVKRTLEGHTNSVESLVVLQNGDLASGSADHTIKIWNTEDGTIKHTLTENTDSVLSLAILPNGDLTNGSGDNTIKIWYIMDTIEQEFLNSLIPRDLGENEYRPILS